MGAVRFDDLEREKIVKWSQTVLWNDDGKHGRDYLLKKRAIKEETARKFKLGYVPANVSHQLANRIIFPIYDASENLIAITSRLVDGTSKLPVYWHERFNKSFYLYGIDLAKSSIRHCKYAVVVEGNFDVVKMHDVGILNAVGMMGTALTEMHIALLLRYCEKAVFIFDNDENKSGQKAGEKAKRMMSQYSSFDCKVFDFSFVQLEGQKDPDEYLRANGVALLKQLIEKQLEQMT